MSVGTVTRSSIFTQHASHAAVGCRAHRREARGTFAVVTSPHHAVTRTPLLWASLPPAGLAMMYTAGAGLLAVLFMAKGGLGQDACGEA